MPLKPLRRLSALPPLAPRPRVWVAAALLLWAGIALAAPEFYLDLQPGQVSVGDVVQLTLRARNQDFSDDQVQNITMEPDADIWHLDAQWRRDWQGKVDNKTGPWHAKLRPFDLGKVMLPPITIAWRDAQGKTTETVLTSQTLEVKSVRVNANSTELIGLRDPLPLEEDLRWLWYVMAGAALGAVLIYLLLAWRERHRTRVAPPAAPPLPPGLWALEELDRRSRLPVNRTGPPKVIFSLVSEVLRMYLGRRYGFNAIDMTTGECMYSLQAIGAQAPPPEVQRWIHEFLEECDLVKFTTLEPAPERWAQIWNDARLIVTQTTPTEELDAAPPRVRQLALGPGAPAAIDVASPARLTTQPLALNSVERGE